MHISKDRYQRLKNLKQRQWFWENQVNRLLKANAQFFNIFNIDVYQAWIDIEPNVINFMPHIADKFSFNLELVLKHIKEPEITNIPSNIYIYEYKYGNISHKLTKVERDVLVYALMLSGSFDKDVEKFYNEMQINYPDSFKGDSKIRILGAYQIFLKRKNQM